MDSRRLVAAMASAVAIAVPGVAEAADGYDDAVLASGPVAYHRMEEAGDAAVALDASPFARDGAYEGRVLGAAGPFLDAGRAAVLSGGASVTADVPVRSGAAEIWIKPGQLKRGEEAGYLSHGDPAGDGWAVGIGTKRKLEFVAGGKDLPTRISVPSGVWTMLAVTWAPGEVRFYLNGSLAKTVSRPGNLPASSRADLRVGGTASGAFSRALQGSVDEVALFPYALMASEVRGHFSAAQVPANVAPPAVAGTLEAGQTLTASAGSWSGVVSSYAYQWQRCDADGDDCGDIPGATATTYALTAQDVGSAIQVAETASNAYGSTTAVSAPRGVVAAAPEPPPGGGDGSTGGGDTSTGGGDGSTGGGDTSTGGGDGSTGGGDTSTGGGDTSTGGGDTSTGGGDTSTGGGDTSTGGGDTSTGGAPAPTPDATAGDAVTPAGVVLAAAATSPAKAPAPTSAADTARTGCLRLVSARKVRLRGAGTLRLGSGCLRAGAPLRISLRPRGAARKVTVRYRLDGRRVTTKRGVQGRLKAARLLPGRHTLQVRVTTRGGDTRSFKLRLRTARR